MKNQTLQKSERPAILDSGLWILNSDLSDLLSEVLS